MTASALFNQSELTANIAPDIALRRHSIDYTHLECLMFSGLLLTVAMFTQAVQHFAELTLEGVKQIDGLEVVGWPDICLVAIKSTSKKLNIYKVNDLVSLLGWHLNPLHAVYLVLMRCCCESHLGLLTAGPERLCVGSDGGPYLC